MSCDLLYAQLQKKQVELLNEEKSPFYLSYNLKLNLNIGMTHMLSGGVENEKERALKKRLIDQFDGSFCL